MILRVVPFKYSWASFSVAPTAEYVIKLSKEIQYALKRYNHRGQLEQGRSGRAGGVINGNGAVFTLVLVPAA